MEDINLNLNINYSDDTEYQECIINVYKIDETEKDIFDGITKKIDILKDKLKDIEEVKQLCNLAGKMMLSEDLEIGLLILHSYDYFDLFYKLYCHYFKTNTIDKTIYEKLLEKIK